MEISVIVPVYNVEPYLKECLDSLCAQRFRDYEIILVDDGSTDNSGRICNEYAERHENITVIHQENQGLSAARNKAIAVAEGRYYTFVDSDDCVECGYLEHLHWLAQEYGGDISVVGHRPIAEEAKNEYRKESAPRKAPQVFTRAQALVEHLVTTSVDVTAWGKLYKKELFVDVEYPVGFLFEDMRTTYRLIQKSEIVVFQDVPLYCYRKRAGSIGHTPFNEKWYGLSEAIDLAYQAARSENPDNKELECFYLQWKMAFVNRMISGRQRDHEMETALKQRIRKCASVIIGSHRIQVIRKIELLLYGFSRSLYRFLYVRMICK